jgi:type VI protein secretion system component Hcp
MIVARIYKAQSQGDDKVKGTVAIAGYRDSDGEPKSKGWFPANSFNLGFNAKQEENQANGTQARGGGGQAQGSQSRANAGASNATSGQSSTQAKASDKKKDEVFSAISISKEVDGATRYLMVLCMEERKAKKGVDSGIHADIHVLSSVDTQQQRFIYPSLMVHLEGVRVEEWNIESSGDERPSETVQLKYDRAAISYQKTADGRTFEAACESGWDQKENKPWSFKKFSDWTINKTV